jgi:hypothetical protein
MIWQGDISQLEQLIIRLEAKSPKARFYHKKVNDTHYLQTVGSSKSIRGFGNSLNDLVAAIQPCIQKRERSDSQKRSQHMHRRFLCVN